jgi:hypothetical protein
MGIICAPAAAGSKVEAKKKRLPIRRNTLREVIENRFSVFLINFNPFAPGIARSAMPEPLTTPRDRTCPAQRTGQQPARARKTTSISSQNRMFLITVVLFLADIVNRYTLISKQKMFPRQQPQASGIGHQASGFRKKKGSRDIPPILILCLAAWGLWLAAVLPRPWTLFPFHSDTETLRHSDTSFWSLHPCPRSLPALPPVTGHRSLTTIFPKWRWRRSRS